jgi:hypothetical protein
LNISSPGFVSLSSVFICAFADFIVSPNPASMNAKKVTLEEIRHQRFATEDVLLTFNDRFERQHKLRTAMALTNDDHEAISLFVKLANGDLIEVASDLIDYEDDFVEIRGGIGIPLKAIVDVGV